MSLECLSRSQRHFWLGLSFVFAGVILHSEEGPPVPNPLHGGLVPWNFNASVFAYLPPDQQDYLQPTVTADRNRLHLEARYNYEDRQTGSLWVGANYQWGETVSVEVTPMLGGVLGQTQGVAPGYRFALAWNRLGLSSEGEYLLDTQDRGDSYFYNWSEITVSLLDWLGVGLVGQRTQAYEAEREFQRGGLASVRVKSFDVGFYVFNLDDKHPLAVLSVGAAF